MSLRKIFLQPKIALLLFYKNKTFKYKYKDVKRFRTHSKYIGTRKENQIISKMLQLTVECKHFFGAYKNIKY